MPYAIGDVIRRAKTLNSVGTPSAASPAKIEPTTLREKAKQDPQTRYRGFWFGEKKRRRPDPPRADNEVGRALMSALLHGNRRAVIVAFGMTAR
ncbi:MAG: hypothetical protein KGL62_10135 [Bradyrhizobium sp.]|uniref:hypothetical protein n=1 Tax=Bradyrhizobium sp. TaxID=376 RepID=UPI0023A663CB|nr:hypothetical protein [Bradyrhizobium sp.]MDE2602711.1 hypothetical protein [Bradyrhizobium sp.]